MILAEWKIQNRWKQVIQDKLSGKKTLNCLPRIPNMILSGDEEDWKLTPASGLTPLEFAAQGGRIGYAGGGDKYEEKVKALMDKMNISRALAETIILTQDYPDASDIIPGEKDGGRIGYQDGRSVRSVALNQLYGIMPKRKEAQEGGLMDLGGMEKDYREEGGYVPIGGQERADDVPARLSKNEFVFTADAVRAAGGGDIDKGAEVMENVMNNLEQGGQVSEESQGLEGARNMFATAQRLEGVL